MLKRIQLYGGNIKKNSYYNQNYDRYEMRSTKFLEQ